MNLKTYDKIMDTFHQNKGFMNFEQLQNEKVTMAQIEELKRRNTLYKFARGWYWCNECGYSKPDDFKYIAVAKMNPKAIICLQSAAHIWGLIETIPEFVDITIERTDRKNMEFDFPVNRYYLKNTGIQDEIALIETEFGNYQVYEMNRTLCDCIRMSKEKTEDKIRSMVKEYCHCHSDMNLDKLAKYAKELKALKTIQKYIRL